MARFQTMGPCAPFCACGLPGCKGRIQFEMKNFLGGFTAWILGLQKSRK